MTSLPASPSWRKQLSRSPGAPGRLLRRRRDNDHPDDFFNSALGRRNHAFLGSSWLLTPAQNVYRQPTLTTSSNATKSHTPFLTIALLKLNEVLPDFVQTSQLGDPALAAKACAVLDSSVATAGSPYNSPAASPASSASRHSAASPRKDRATSSIGSSSSAPVGQRGPPLLQWLTSSADSRRENHASTSPASSALVIEGEWETYVAPFLLLAAAEVLYHDMQLQGLAVIYQRIIADMLSVKQILCDPILGQLLLTPPASATASSMLMTSVEAATSLATMIDTLTAFCTCRIQLVDLQRTCTPQALALFTVLLQTASAHPQRNELFERLLQECNAWKFCIETCLALEQCRYVCRKCLLSE